MDDRVDAFGLLKKLFQQLQILQVEPVKLRTNPGDLYDLIYHSFRRIAEIIHNDYLKTGMLQFNHRVRTNVSCSASHQNFSFHTMLFYFLGTEWTSIIDHLKTRLIIPGCFDLLAAGISSSLFYCC